MSYNPQLLFRNRHLQSILPSLKLRKPFVKRRVAPLIESAEEVIIDCGDGIRLQGFFSAHDESDRDLAILIHGWEGSSDSIYLLSAAGELFKNGCNVFRLNMRDHGTSHYLNKKLFNSCRLDEVVNAVKYIRENFSNQKKVFLCGFSLGGNFALRVAAKAPDAGIKLDHVIAVCPVLKPASTLDAIDKGLFVYEKYFIRKWKKSLRKKEKLFPDDFDFKDKTIYKNLSIMTEYFVDKFTKYPDLDTYLDGYAITGKRLANLKIPAHIIASQDDPVIPYADTKDMAVSENLTLIGVKYGGHCGFMKGFNSKSWADDTIVRLLCTV